MLNKIILQGRIANDLSIEKTSSGVSVCKFTVASQRNLKEKDGTRGTDFVPCVTFNKSAEFMCNYFKKGSQVIVTGRLNVNNYEKEGKKMTYTNIVVDSVDFCDSKSVEPEQKETPDISKAPVPTVEDLPFDF